MLACSSVGAGAVGGVAIGPLFYLVLVYALYSSAVAAFALVLVAALALARSFLLALGDVGSQWWRWW